MTVGLDTFITDEDYVELFGTYAGKHYAEVTNSLGQSDVTNTAVSGSSTGKADIKHVSTPVTYTAYWNVP